MYAVETDSEQIVEILLDNKAELDARDEVMYQEARAPNAHFVRINQSQPDCCIIILQD